MVEWRLIVEALTNLVLVQDLLGGRMGTDSPDTD